jgi:hypothetical protein
MASLKDILVDVCASCTQPVSVFKQSFERAGHGLVQSPGLSVSMGMQPALNNDFNR